MRAMILAAGRGERMRPLTDHTPKPLLQAGGKPLIVWHIERLVRAGIVDLVINHAHLGKQIEEYLGDGSLYGARIRYSDEGTALETAGGIAFAMHLLCEPSPLPPLPQVGEGNQLPSTGTTSQSTKPASGQVAGYPASGRGIEGEGEVFAVVNGDVYCDYDFSRLPSRAAALANNNNDMARLVLVNNPEHNLKGDFGLNGGRVLTLPPSPFPLPDSFTFSGIGLYKPALFANIARGSKAPLAPLLREQIAQGRVSGELHRGTWVDVGTPQRLDELDKQLRATQNT
jgi:MurNAc alpha-1-phosphate uridylyltransferase